MDKKGMRAIAALLVATIVFMGVVHVKAPAARYVNKNAIDGTEEALDVSSAENIKEAVKVLNVDGSVEGYIVTVAEEGFGGEIVMDVTIDSSMSQVLSINVTKQSETENLGAKIVGEEFRAQFAGVEAPVYLPGMLTNTDAQTGATVEVPTGLWESLQDGVYNVETEEIDGYRDVLELTVADGKVTGIVWDCVDAEGVGKRLLSEQGYYVMTEDGLSWTEQAEALAAAVIDSQSAEFLNTNEQGKTDAVAGVSISIGGFVNALEDALIQASGQAALILHDGSYEIEAGSGDFTDIVTMTVADGKITEITLESVDADGNKKSVLSENGQYVMTEDGLTWKEQAEALAAAVIEHQGTAFLNLDEQGKTDAVAGVSVSISGFVNMLEDLMEEAAGIAPTEEVVEEEAQIVTPEQGTVVDAISGATISSTAVVNGVNRAVEFLKQL